MSHKSKIFLCLLLVVAMVSLTIFAGLSVHHALHVHKDIDNSCPVCNIIIGLNDLELAISALAISLCFGIIIQQIIAILAYDIKLKHITPITLRVKLLD